MKKVLCSGTFDVLHDGHLKFLKDAKRQGDYLIVNVINDRNVFENKGRYPINNQEKRILNLKRLGIADEIIAVSDDNNKNMQIIKEINPDIIVFGYDQSSKFINELKKFLDKEKIYPKYYISKEFAGGIHSSKLKK